MRLVKNAPEGFSDLEGKYVLKVRLKSRHITAIRVINIFACFLRRSVSQREIKSVLMVVSTSGNFLLSKIKRNFSQG